MSSIEFRTITEKSIGTAMYRIKFQCWEHEKVPSISLAEDGALLYKVPKNLAKQNRLKSLCTEYKHKNIFSCHS